MSYLGKLKAKTSHLEELPKVPKGIEPKKNGPPTYCQKCQKTF